LFFDGDLGLESLVHNVSSIISLKLVHSLRRYLKDISLA
jgi:hypothetical protein